MDNKFNFKLTKLYNTGDIDDPKVYKIENLPDDWDFNRRSFLTYAGAMAGTFISLPVIGNIFNNKNADESLFKSAIKIKAHNGSSLKINFSPDSDLLVSTASDKKLKIWEIPDCKLKKTMDQDVDIDCFTFAPEKNCIAVGTKKNVRFLNLLNPEKINKTISIENIFSIDYSINNSFFTLNASSGEIYLYNNASMKQRHVVDAECMKRLPLAFNKQHDFISTINAQNELLLYATDSYQTFFEQHSNNLLVSNLANYLLLYSKDNSYKLWELPIGNLVKTYSCEAKITAICFSAKGEFVVAGTENGEVKIYATSGEFEKKISHDAKITSLSFSNNGRYLASASDDGVIKLWDIPDFNYITCLFDKDAMVSTKEVNQYTSKNKFGELVTFTLPCGSPIPDGAICVCNCVPGNACSCVGYTYTCGCVGYSSRIICQCDKICTCVPIK